MKLIHKRLALLAFCLWFGCPSLAKGMPTSSYLKIVEAARKNKDDRSLIYGLSSALVLASEYPKANPMARSTRERLLRELIKKLTAKKIPFATDDVAPSNTLVYRSFLNYQIVGSSPYTKIVSKPDCIELYISLPDRFTTCGGAQIITVKRDTPKYHQVLKQYWWFKDLEST